jgi:hypothetical protein
MTVPWGFRRSLPKPAEGGGAGAHHELTGGSRPGPRSRCSTLTPPDRLPLDVSVAPASTEEARVRHTHR